MAKIYVNNEEIDCNTNKTLLENLLEQNIFVNNPCNGKGLCGKCKVKIVKGRVSSPSETERSILSEDDIVSGIRLSCLLSVSGDMEIELLQKERKHSILTTGFIPEFNFNPSIYKKCLYIEKPSLANQISYEDSLMKAFKVKNIDFNVYRDEILYGEVTGVFNGKDLIGIESGNTKDTLYGVAIDIGTTTVVASLVDINTGEELESESMINAQKKFGLDILTRITYKLENSKSGQKELQQTIVESINRMIKSICERVGISENNIYEITVAANSTMIHFLLGINTDSIGRSPYIPAFVRAKTVLASSIGLKINKRAKLYCLPSVSSYIGADIVAGTYVCDLHNSSENILFIDIGTNGEIVLANRGKLLSCSCAAGPALEGMNISYGMRAAEGAIEDVKITEKGIELKVIGDKEPIGICGSGILAVLKELLRIGIVKNRGAFIKKDKIEENDYRFNMIQENGTKREFILNENPRILVTQSDIRQVQLAKGAILSGFYALLKKANLTMEDLDKVIVAGQFGSHLPVESLVGIGILPSGIESKIKYVGNSSKTGAYMCLMSEDVKKNIENVSRKIDYMEIGASENYERLFTECLIFPNMKS